MAAPLRRPPLGMASARPASEPRGRRTELSAGTTWRRRCERSTRRRGRPARPARSARPARPPGLPRPRRWWRRIRAGHRGAKSGRGHPEASRDQRTSDQLLDLHCAHQSSLSTVSSSGRCEIALVAPHLPVTAPHVVRGDAATVGSQPEADLKMAGKSVSPGRPARSRPSGATCPARAAPVRRRRISPAPRTRLWGCRGPRRG